MYNLNFECENIFNDKHPYKVHCIGKCEKGNGPHYYDAYYYFLSHDRKYVLKETLHGLEDINIVLKEVEKYELPSDPEFKYEVFKREVVTDYKYNMIKEMEDMTYSRDGFFIFKQMYYQNGHAVMGGIVDIYEYAPTTATAFKRTLDSCKYDK